MKLDEEAAHNKTLEGFNKKFVSENAGWGRIFTYYKPLWASFLMLFLAFINSIQFLIAAGFVAGLVILFMEYFGVDNKEMLLGSDISFE
jgi:hypothetical protein